jgi:hypothetical protein
MKKMRAANLHPVKNEKPRKTISPPHQRRGQNCITGRCAA